MRSRADANSAQVKHPPLASVKAVEKESEILDRLERIDGLRREDAPAAVLLDEVRSLLADAEEWLRAEPDAPGRAAAAIQRSREALAAGELRAERLIATP